SATSQHDVFAARAAALPSGGVVVSRLPSDYHGRQQLPPDPGEGTAQRDVVRPVPTRPRPTSLCLATPSWLSNPASRSPVGQVGERRAGPRLRYCGPQAVTHDERPAGAASRTGFGTPPGLFPTTRESR